MCTYQQTRKLTGCGKENCNRSERHAHISSQENSRPVGGRIAISQRDMHTAADKKTHTLWKGELRQVREMCTHQQMRKLTGCERENCNRSERHAHSSRQENSPAVGRKIATGQRDVHTSAEKKTHTLWEGELQQVRETCTHLQTRKLTPCGRENCNSSERHAHISREENSRPVGGRIATGQRNMHTSADKKTHALWVGELQQVKEMCTHLQMRKLTGFEGRIGTGQRDIHTSAHKKTH
jgi:hypothetical protein